MPISARCRRAELQRATCRHKKKRADFKLTEHPTQNSHPPGNKDPNGHALAHRAKAPKPKKSRPKEFTSSEIFPETSNEIACEQCGLVFLTPLNSPLKDFLNEIHQIARFEPAIVERIDEDLDLYAKKKKLLRLADAQFLQGQTPDLPKLQLQLHELKLEEIELKTGRPRTDAYVVYVFLMLRGFNGGCKDQQARLLLEESLTLKLWLERLGLELPAASTLSDNLNAVSNATRGFIEQAQLGYIFEQGLDDFGKCFIDSTAVEANTDRPTDSALMVKLIRRICALGGHLHRRGMPDMNQVGLEEQQEELRRMSQQILFLNGKARGQGRRQKLYFQLIRRVRRLRKRLLRDLEQCARTWSLAAIFCRAVG